LVIKELIVISSFMFSTIANYVGVNVAYAQTSISTSTVGSIVDSMLSDIVSLFTDNIGTVLTFAVSFMVLALLLALARRFFRL